jgi:Zn-dependent protease with chaperone function/RNA polymerase subunit RPABC4/transcription elongation factor Spt4
MRVNARDFIHPEDAAAQEQLRGIPMFDQFVKTFLKVFQEQLFLNQYLSQAVRLGPNQLPHIHRHLVECCQVLDVEVPEMYLHNAGEVNAFSLGDTRRFVVVTADLVEACDDDELRAVIAHEVGHLVCRHTLYKTMAWVLFHGGAQILGPLSIAVKPIEVALAYWSRRSEFSADRAAAVVLGGPQPVVETMIRLSGGPKSITADVNVEEYLRQAEDFDKLAENAWSKVLQLMSVMEATHPFSALRAREIVRWCEGEQYRRIAAALAGGTAAGPACPSCGAQVGGDWKFCRSCGAGLLQVAAPSEGVAEEPASAASAAEPACPACGARVEGDWKFCRSCGATLLKLQVATPPGGGAEEPAAAASAEGAAGAEGPAAEQPS